jgi:hypothetical protein
MSAPQIFAWAKRLLPAPPHKATVLIFLLCIELYRIQSVLKLFFKLDKNSYALWTSGSSPILPAPTCWWSLSMAIIWKATSSLGWFCFRMEIISRSKYDGNISSIRSSFTFSLLPWLPIKGLDSCDGLKVPLPWLEKLHSVYFPIDPAP